MGESHWEPSSRLQQYIWSLELNCKVLLSCSTVAGQNRLTQSYWRLAPLKGTSQVWEKLLIALAFSQDWGSASKAAGSAFQFHTSSGPALMPMCKAFRFHETGLCVEDFGTPLVLSLLCFGALWCSWNMSVRRQQLSTGKRLIRFELFSIGVSFSGYQIACNFRHNVICTCQVTTDAHKQGLGPWEQIQRYQLVIRLWSSVHF